MLTVAANGDKVQENPDGSVISTFADGRQKQSTPDGTSLEKLLDGTKIQTMPVRFHQSPHLPSLQCYDLLHALLTSLASLSLTSSALLTMLTPHPGWLTLHSLHAFVGPRPPFSLAPLSA